MKGPKIKWNPVAGVAGYHIYWGSSPDINSMSLYASIPIMGCENELVISRMEVGQRDYFRMTTYLEDGTESHMSEALAVIWPEESKPPAIDGYQTECVELLRAIATAIESGVLCAIQVEEGRLLGHSQIDVKVVNSLALVGIETKPSLNDWRKLRNARRLLEQLNRAKRT